MLAILGLNILHIQLLLCLPISLCLRHLIYWLCSKIILAVIQIRLRSRSLACAYACAVPYQLSLPST
jgi:hypothetical protein